MATNLENKLKENLPAFQQGNVSLDEFLTAVGKLLDGFATSIDSVKYYSDYQKIDNNHLDDLAGQFDLNFPRSVSNDRKREAIKNAIARFRSNGTERSLKEVFRLIGWKVIIDYTWTLNPAVATQVQYLYNGTITYNGTATYNNNPVVSPVGLYSLVFGKEVIYANGTYADLYDNSGNFYPKNTILGEQYGLDVTTDLLVVAKAPYIRITITEEDYNLFTSDVTDPNTGQVYSYDDTEKFNIAQDIIKFFLDQSRPANVAILEIATPFNLRDSITDMLDDTGLTTTSLNVGARYDGTITYDIPMDRYVMGETFGGFQYSTTAMTLYPAPAPVAVTRTYPIGSFNTQAYIPTRKNASLDLTVPSDCIVKLYTSVSDRIALANGTATWVFVGNYTNVTNQIVGILNKFAIRLNISTPSSIGNVVAVVTEL